MVHSFHLCTEVSGNNFAKQFAEALGVEPELAAVRIQTISRGGYEFI